ncbi:DNA-binding transcriptional regulator, LysR family [Amycolatopsis arida]|uniref:DNA-binding transcriptional regulator, LysR family n=1 Tax=Amycolatopsis arida TaxID=587909 RepID=A0A1I5LX20_9PSEU|nr:LysR family transcriptional regulator [Amycolatopsis arida]TDX93884.1 DNA-binding transcriptional LysR family regulator [Amycolatopsis arida]SFP01879.1 DNA-binding transcriptional regulator, LysR family [Amycolatopsis arida]
MFDLRRLRVLQVLAEHGTVTATAAALHLTPSAVSQQLRQLARDLDVELLRADGRRVRLTPVARVLLAHADTLATQWEQARAELAAHRHEPVAGTLRICAVSSAIAALGAPAAVELRRTHPRLRVLLREEESGDCFALLRDDEADLAVVLPTPDTPPVADPRFDQHPLLDDPQDLLVRRGHRLDRPEGVALAEAAGEPWIVKPHHNDTHPLLTAACAAAGFTPRIEHQAKEWFAVSALVAAGCGVCLLPRIVPVPAEHPVVRVPLHGNPRPSRRFVACVRRGAAEHPVLAAGLAALAATHQHGSDTVPPRS